VNGSREFEAARRTSAEASETDGWSKVGILMLVLSAGLAIVVAYYIATSGEVDPQESAAKASVPSGLQDSEEPALDLAEPTASAKPVAASEPAATTPPAAGPAAALQAAAAELPAKTPEEATAPAAPAGQPLRENGEVDRPANLVTMAIESDPPGATVIRKRDGVRLGKTPYRYSVEPSASEVHFLVQLDGHKTIALSMPGDQNSVRQVVLLPGDGGEVVPDAPATAKSDAPEPAEKTPPAKQAVPAKKAAPAKQTSVARKQRGNKKPRRSKPARSKPAKKSSKRKGTVDYQAEPLPLD
jgi:hypothetical protein